MGGLGSPPNRMLLDTLRPERWYSAHLHVRFTATVKHNPPAASGNSNFELSGNC